MLNRHYLDRLDHEIRKGWACRENTGNRRVYIGTKKGVYFFIGEFIVEGELIPLVKIGYSIRGIGDRCRGFRKQNPSDMYLIYHHKEITEKEARETEAYYHKKFREFRVRGEWFHLKPVALALGLDWEKMNEQ